MQQIGWGTICQPSNSPLTWQYVSHLTDHSLDNKFRLKSAINETDFRHALTDVFASQTPEFHPKGISKLERRWGKVLDADGDYLHDL